MEATYSRSGRPGLNEIYNDVWVRGQTLIPGVRPATPRFDAISRHLALYQRRFTLLDLGANSGYFGLRAANEFDCVSVMVDAHADAAEYCRKNVLPRTIFLQRFLSVDDLQWLGACEHFDVVLCLNFLHHFEDWPVAVDTVLNLGTDVIIETPHPSDSGACGQGKIGPLFEYLKGKNGTLLGTFEAHTSKSKRPMWLFHGERFQITKPFYCCPDAIQTDAEITADHISKTVRFSRKEEQRSWTAGINLYTYMQLGGIYPEREAVAGMLREVVLPETHGDVTPWNFIFDGSNVYPIDAGDAAHRSDSTDTVGVEESIASLGLGAASVAAHTNKETHVWTFSGRPGYQLQDALTAACNIVHPVDYLEVGVDGGGSFQAVLKAAKLGHAVLCDIWDPTYCNHGLANHDHIVEMLSGRNAPLVEFLDGDSRETLPTLAGRQFDLITVDGGHSPGVARADLENCWPLLRVGGILAFDDISHRNHPHLEGVFRAFLARHPDALLIPEATAPWKNTALLTKHEGWNEGQNH